MNKFVWNLVLAAAILPLAATCSDNEEPKTYTFDARIGDVAESHHALVGSGDAAKEALFASDVDWQALYDGVRTMGAEAGHDATNLDNDAWKQALMNQGTEMEMIISWTEANGGIRTVTLDDAIAVSSSAQAQTAGTLDLRFTGNNKEQAMKMPGHRLCATSCPFGVVTNGALPVAAIDTHTFGVRSAVLPPSGSAVRVSLGLRAGVRSGLRAASGR